MNVIDEENEPEVYYYSKIIRPTSMRSTYWKFFGFPADESGSVITRRSVICSICGVGLSYNKNTSNLKSHFGTKHQEQMNFTCTPLPPKKPKFIYAPTGNDHQNNDVKQIYNVKQQPNEAIVASPEDLIEKLAEDMEADDYQETNDDYQIEYLTSDDVHNFDEEPTMLKPVVNSGSNKSLKRKSSSGNMLVMNIESSVVSMIIDDLLPITISEGTGFLNFVTSLSGSRVQVPNAKAIEKHIQRLHKTEYNRLSQSIKNELGDKFFSLGFEKWNNCDESTFITTYINYVVDDEEFNTIVLNVVDPGYVTDWDRHFNILKMKNCTACVVDFDIDGEETLKVFLESHKIPIIPCFLTTIAKGGGDIEQTPELPYQAAIHEHSRFVPDVADPPKINKNFWLTKMNFIEFIYEFLVNNSERIEADTNQLTNDIKTLIDCLTPLKLTLETLSMEQHPLSSLIRPLTSQLINSHFLMGEEVSELENELNAIIHKELEDSLTSSSNFLMQSSFMDPRFQNLQIPEDVKVIKMALKKLNDIDPAEAVDTLVLKKENGTPKTSPKTSLPKKKSAGLKFFFGNKEQKSTPNKTIDRFDMEFTNYNTNADAGLDQLVLPWWKESALLYPNLKKLANRFNCVLLSVQKCDTNLNKQIAFYEKRAMCSGNIVDCLLRLHQNRNNDMTLADPYQVAI